MPDQLDLIYLDYIRLSDIQHWGKKACMLGELRAHGFPVPDGVCLSTVTFRKTFPNFKISAVLDRKMRTISDELLLTSKSLAVRSSAFEEDLNSISFAGVYESVIGLSKAEDIGTAVQRVWKSYTSHRAIATRAAVGLEDSYGGMGVLIQPLIDAEVAGVCFSVDPVQPNTGRLVIDACWGLGVGVVAGSVPVDTMWLRREDLGILKRRTVEKGTQLTLDSEGVLVQKSVPEQQQRTACLPDDWASRIAQFNLAIEQTIGQPQEVEWAIADGKVWILQSRPIASLDGSEGVEKYLFPVHWDDPDEARRTWKRTRIEQQGSSPLFPIDIDYIKLKESTRVETCLRMGVDRNQDLLEINGQIYTSPAPMPISSVDLHVRQQAYRDLQTRLNQDGRNAWDHWGPEIESANERLTAVDTSGMDGPSLANFLEEAMAVLTHNNRLHPLMWFKPQQSYFDSYEAVSGFSGKQAETFAYQLLEAGETPLTRLIDGLYSLAEKGRKNQAVADWMLKTAKQPENPNIKTLADFPISVEGTSKWLRKFEEFLCEFGDRNGHGYGSEALISTPTWRDQPLLAIKLVVQYLNEQVKPPKLKRERIRQAIEVEVEELCSKCKDPQMVDNFQKQLQMARKVFPVLEIHNHHIEQVGQGQLRRAVLAAADWLQSVEVLPEPNDVLWLTFSEIVMALRKPEKDSLAKEITERKKTYYQWAQFEPPPYLGLPATMLPPRTTETRSLIDEIRSTKGEIHGVGASPGRVSGRARVIENWESEPMIVPGDILVAENAGPLWTPFFPILAGIVLEIGSLGQHAATTAREYGIPAVMDVPNARQLIQDGDWIIIDGERGNVCYPTS